jgi:outer membrane protein OmpA-like peptidoglycan-associated protein
MMLWSLRFQASAVEPGLGYFTYSGDVDPSPEVAMSDEPTLEKGVSGEWVVHLQELMRDGGFWQRDVNGTFDGDLEQAVRTLQDDLGLPRTGMVDGDTWSALEQRTQLTQQPAQADGSADTGADTGQPATPYLSEDGQWQWDGTQWTHTQTAQPAQPSMHLSEDGQWQWDGTQWQPTAANPLSGGLHLPAGGPDQHARPDISSASTDSSLTGFATGSAVLTAEHQTILAGIAADLNANPLIFGSYVTLTGYADRRGDPAANQELGQRRADAVRAYLLQLLTDDETRQQIRAYSLGAPTDGPAGDVPALRKVEIEITRRTYNANLGPSLTPPGAGTPAQSTPELDLNLPAGYGISPPNPNQPSLPDWFWQELPKHPADPPFVTQLSHWLNQTLQTHDLARIGGQIAGHFHMDSAQVTRMLDDAFQKAGEEGVKATLRAVIQGIAGPPAHAPDSPTGPPGTPAQ